MTDFSHPLDPVELELRKQQAAEFAAVRDQIALSRGLEPHQQQLTAPEGATTETERKAP